MDPMSPLDVVLNVPVSSMELRTSSPLPIPNSSFGCSIELKSLHKDSVSFGSNSGAHIPPQKNPALPVQGNQTGLLPGPSLQVQYSADQSQNNLSDQLQWLSSQGSTIQAQISHSNLLYQFLARAMAPLSSSVKSASAEQQQNSKSLEI